MGRSRKQAVRRPLSGTGNQRARQQAGALVLLALLSMAWTSFLTFSSADATSTSSGNLPEEVVLPLRALTVPASVNAGKAAMADESRHLLSKAAKDGIPAVALAAYQRAAQVIDMADPGCNLNWTLIAAIGRIESEHGRHGGSVLTHAGESSPGVFGPPLNGSQGNKVIKDTDAGIYDLDRRWDRAVGPMQFIPSTWSVVGVDGDGDGRRDPQDIDDAALAAAVYLCSGREDLGTDSGQSVAVHRYNHSASYVRLVLSVAAMYAEGAFVAAPSASYAPTYFSRSEPAAEPPSPNEQPTKSSSGSIEPKGSMSLGDPVPVSPPVSQGPHPAKRSEKTLLEATGPAVKSITGAVSPLEAATRYCQSNVSTAKLDLLGGLQTCAQAYVSGGADAVSSLVGSTGDLLTALLPSP